MLRTVSNTHAQAARVQLCASHVQHIERLSRASVMLLATWCKGTAQLLSLTEFKSHLFELYFVGWIIKQMKEGRKPEYPEKTPGDELQKMPHTTARRFKPKARLTRAVALVAGLESRHANRYTMRRVSRVATRFSFWKSLVWFKVDCDPRVSCFQRGSSRQCSCDRMYIGLLWNLCDVDVSIKLS